MSDLPYQEVLNFWFDEIDPTQWWVKDEAFDKEIDSRFGDLHKRACNCELFAWRITALGRLAEIIILDQFTRNIYRDKPEAFMADPLALGLAQEAVAVGFDAELEVSKRNLLYMPYMHSESAKIHSVAVDLFARLDSPYYVEFELKHKVIIDRFGRYPHRNEVLGRISSPSEVEFLKQKDSSF